MVYTTVNIAIDQYRRSTMKKKWQDQIDRILYDVSFVAWATDMKRMGWTWYGDVNPTVEQLRENAERALTRVVEEKLLCSGSGGITAIKAKGRLFLCLGHTYDGEDW